MDIDEFLESLMKTETAPKFPLSMYYSEGTKYLNLFQYEKAIEFLNKALEQDPTDFKSLLKRSKCFIGLGRYEEAMNDANNVLKLYPAYAQAIDLKGQVQYLMGDFEGGYLTYSRGRDMKPVNNELRLGKQLCEDAINNALRPHVKIKMKNKDVESIVHAKDDRKKIDNRLKYRKSRRDCFDEDVKFLKDLMKDKNLTSIHETCKETMDFIKQRERFWVMETPLHSRKKRQSVKMKGIKKSDEGEKQVQICLAAKRRAENELSKGRIDYCISEARQLLRFGEFFPKQREKEKMKFHCDAYHLLSSAYDNAGNSRFALQYLQKELEVAHEFNLLLPQLRAYHQLGENYQHVGDVTSTLLCLHEVANADVEKVMTEEISDEEGKQLQDAMDWANNIINCVKMSIRESIIGPLVDALTEYSELNTNAEPKMKETEIPESIEKSIAEDLTKFRTESEESIKLEKDDLKRSMDSIKHIEDEQKLRRGIVADDSDESKEKFRAVLNELIREIDTVNSEMEEDKGKFELGRETEGSSSLEKDDSKNKILVDSIHGVKKSKSEQESRRLIEDAAASDGWRAESISDLSEFSQEKDTMSSDIEKDGKSFELEAETGESSNYEKDSSKSTLLDESKDSMESTEDEQESRRKIRDVTEESREKGAENIADLSDLNQANRRESSKGHGEKSSYIIQDEEPNNLFNNNNVKNTEVDNVFKNLSKDIEQRDEPNAHDISGVTNDLSKDQKNSSDTDMDEIKSSSKSVELERSRSRDIGKKSSIPEKRNLDDLNIRNTKEKSKEFGAHENEELIESSSQYLPVREDIEIDDSEGEERLENISDNNDERSASLAEEISNETNDLREPEDQKQSNNTDKSKTESTSKSFELEKSKSKKIGKESSILEDSDLDKSNIQETKEESKKMSTREKPSNQSLPVREHIEINDSEVEESLELHDSSDSDK